MFDLSWALPVITGGSLKVFQGLQPITSLKKKGKKFDWNHNCEESYKNLKTLLTSAPILRIADPNNKEFVLCTDACNDGLGGVLTQ